MGITTPTGSISGSTSIVRRLLVFILLCSALAACSSGTSSLAPPAPAVPVPPIANGPTPTPVPATPTPAPAPTFNPAAVRITEYTAPVSPPQYLAAAPDGSLYMGNGGNGTGSNLYRYLNGSSTQVAPAPPPQGYAPGGGVYGITATANQIYWLSAYNGSGFTPQITVECGGSGIAALCEPTVDQPTSMLLDASGTFWVGGWAFSGGGAIMTSSGASGQFSGGIVQLTMGPGAAVWGILESYPSYAIARFAIANGNVAVVNQFPLPSGEAAGSITYGGDGALWFTDHQRNAIGRIDANGTIVEYALPTANALGQPWYGLWQITTACDGAVWFSEPQAGKIGRIDAKGGIIELSMPSANAYPDAISAAQPAHCAAPEVWVAEQYAGKIASIAY